MTAGRITRSAFRRLSHTVFVSRSLDATETTSKDYMGELFHAALGTEITDEERCEVARV